MPSSAARRCAAATMPSATSVETSRPPGSSPRAARKPVSPTPAATSTIVSPGCGSSSRTIRSATTAPMDATSAFRRSQAGAEASQLARVSARVSSPAATQRKATLTRMDPLSVFSAPTRAWFERAFGEPTPAQAQGWPAIASGEHTLIQAPTGSGKTLAAFLYGIDRLAAEPGEGLRLLYVSPLKALNYDIERNLRGPLAGLQSELRVAVRTGDTSQKERAAMLREHPDILITTPESLYLMLTSRAREMLASVQTLILDEVHAVAGTKRGAHMELSVERLDRLVQKPVQRIALSATQRPMEEIGRFVSGGRPIELVDAGRAKELDLQVVVPVEDMREPAAGSELTDLLGTGGEGGTQSIWPSIYPELLELVRAHRSTIVFVNNRRLAERLALRLNELAEKEIARAHHGSLAREQRLEV